MEVMLADDIDLFLSHENIDTLFAIMNVELENVSMWFKSNKLSLNVDETKWSLFYPLPKKDRFFHRPCLIFLLKIFIPKENMKQNF